MYWWHWWPFIPQMLLPNNMDYLTAVAMMLNNIYFILFLKKNQFFSSKASDSMLAASILCLICQFMFASSY